MSFSAVPTPVPTPLTTLAPDPTAAPTHHRHHQTGALPDHLRVEPWSDPVIDTHGHDTRSPYVERFWIAVLGPSAVWLLRRIARDFDEHPNGVDIDLRSIAGQLGLGWNRGKNSPLYRTIDRCCAFKVARRLGPTSVAFRQNLAPLTRGQLARLPLELADEHDQWIQTHRPRPVGDDASMHAPAMAMALVERGASLHATVDALTSWQVPLEDARRATSWAWARYKQHPSGAALS